MGRKGDVRKLGAVRALIDEVRLVLFPADPKAPLGIEVRGELAAMMALGSGWDASAAEQLEKQFKLVAGARNHRETHASVLDLALVLNSFAPRHYAARSSSG